MKKVFITRKIPSIAKEMLEQHFEVSENLENRQLSSEELAKATYDPNLFLGEELFGKTLGIVGFGRTGRAVARRALGFGLKVIIYHYKTLTFSEEENKNFTQVPFDQLLSQSDYISLHVPLKEETRFLIDARAFEKMEKRPVLINMARGAIIQTDDLVTALKTAKIRGAALDVTFPEPLSHHTTPCANLRIVSSCLISDLPLRTAAFAWPASLLKT